MVWNTKDHQARSRFLLVQAITAQFWKIWIRDFFPTLLVRHKWHVRQRNMMVNDVCLLKDEDAFRSEWKLGRVVEVYPDRFGNVRNVEVMVKPAQDGSSIYKPSGGQLIRRHVNNLLLLVPLEEQDASKTKTSVERAEDKSKAVGATVGAELHRDASRNDDEDNRCKSSNAAIVESQSNVCQNL